jgi:hypothetical protein
MTSFDFRSSPERVGAMRELIQNTVLAEAIVCLKDSRPPTKVPSGADGLDRAEILGRIQQHEADIDLLLSLAEPLPPEPAEEPPDWGVDETKFNLQPK